MKKVLIVDDNEKFQDLCKNLLSERYEVISALSIPQAQGMFAAYRFKGFHIIAVDGCVPGTELNTTTLVKEIRQTFFRNMIAISSIPEFRKKLMEAGCNLECEKDNLVKLLLEMPT